MYLIYEYSISVIFKTKKKNRWKNKMKNAFMKKNMTYVVTVSSLDFPGVGTYIKVVNVNSFI